VAQRFLTSFLRRQSPTVKRPRNKASQATSKKRFRGAVGDGAAERLNFAIGPLSWQEPIIILGFGGSVFRATEALARNIHRRIASSKISCCTGSRTDFDKLD
jgi:hypothetical protein